MAGMCQLLRCGDLIHVIRVVCQKCKKNRKYGVFFVFALTTGISFGYFMSTHRLSDERIMRSKWILIFVGQNIARYYNKYSN